MNSLCLSQHLPRAAAALLTAAAACGALAQTPAPVTLDLLYTQGRLSAGLPEASATNLRGTWLLGAGQVARLEVLDERKFGAHGGILAGSYTRDFSPDGYATGTLAFGQGGPNWARRRVDIDVATKWRAERDVVSHVAVYGAGYDADRSDRGLRVSLVGYLPAAFVIEGGIIFNLSQPGAVHSRMPYASVLWGREGEQYLSLRLSSGSEAYQALGADKQLVDFNSSSAGLSWRRWLGPRWGFLATAEHYRNPSYRRNTLGLGLLVQL